MWAVGGLGSYFVTSQVSEGPKYLPDESTGNGVSHSKNCR